MISIVSFNLRCVYNGEIDGANSFIHRSGMILDKIAQEKPDVICFQECVDPHYEFLSKHLDGYTLVFNRRNSDYSGEGLAVALKKDRMELYGFDVFWLSETPRIAGSRFKIQSPCPRICQCITLRDGVSGKLFRVYNVHLDHVSDEARILGIHQILDYAYARQEENELPLFLLGDFNALPDSETVRYCDNFEKLPICDLTRESGGTWHDFGRKFTAQGDESMKIDYIYTDKGTAEKNHTSELWKDEFNGIYLSDHYPLCLKTEL